VQNRLGDLPKPLIDVCGKPLLERQILLLKSYGFDQVLILVSYRADYIKDYCRSRSNWDIDVQCLDDGEPRGTAGAILSVFNQLAVEFLVMYGDTMLQVDLARFVRFHTQGMNAAATLLLHPNDHPQDSDLVEVDESGKIIAFHPYPHPDGYYLPNLVNAALYCMRRDALEPWRSRTGMLDFGKNIFPEMLELGLLLRGYNSPEYIKDVGTPERIDKVCVDLVSGRVDMARLDHEQMAVFLDRDGTINKEVRHLNSPEQFEILPGVGDAIRRLNHANYRVCIVTNQPVIARGECSVETLRQIHNKMETLLGHEGAYVDRIIYCPHHPDRGFEGEISDLKCECCCRKPGTGMIDSVVAEFNIARSSSWLVGDSSSDILAAKRAGLHSILVETGYAGLDEKYLVTPDYNFADLPRAVNFIIEGHPRLMESLEPLAANLKAGEMVFIGGQSRSGKSMIASALRDLLRSQGINSVVLSTDRWLRGESKRSDGVLGRHDDDHLRDAIAKIDTRNGTLSLNINAYRKLKREQIVDAEHLRIESDDVVIVEGVIALYVSGAASRPHRFYVSIDEEERRQRVLREYLLRGWSETEATAIYENRLIDEVPWVNASASSAVYLSVVDHKVIIERNHDYK
jgi:histidinol-phosphate phosphatase family protein